MQARVIAFQQILDYEEGEKMEAMQKTMVACAGGSWK